MRDIVDAICDSADAITDLIEDDSAGDPDNEGRRRLLRKLQDAAAEASTNTTMSGDVMTTMETTVDEWGDDMDEDSWDDLEDSEKPEWLCEKAKELLADLEEYDSADEARKEELEDDFAQHIGDAIMMFFDMGATTASVAAATIAATVTILSFWLWISQKIL